MAYISGIFLDDKSIVRRTPEVEHERKVAMADLLEANHFEVIQPLVAGPYQVLLKVRENRLSLSLTPDSGAPSFDITIMIQPFRGIIRDYFMICESYFDAIKHAPLARIEALDMGRRAVHNEGSELLQQLLREQVHMDSNTARRLFTLICVLHIR